MDRVDVQAVKQRISCVELAGRYTTLRKASRFEYEGPCPKCGGTDRFHVKPDGWFCRSCNPIGEHGWHDAPEFLQWMDGLTFPEAIEALNGGTLPSGATLKTPAPAHRQRTEQTPDWTAHATRCADAWAEAFPGSPAETYLTQRGLTPAICADYHLGYTAGCEAMKVRPEWQVPAVTMPWYKGGRIVGIRYRFLRMVGKDKSVSMGGSDFTSKLYGGHVLFCDPLTDDRTLAKRRLVLCEGEINAISIAQVTANLRTDVLSVGSQDTILTDAQIAFFRRYGTRIVWMDAPSRRDKVAGLVSAHTSIASQATDDKGAPKTDANDCLRKGTLWDTMIKAFRAGPDAEALKWDLWDAENL